MKAALTCRHSVSCATGKSGTSRWKTTGAKFWRALLNSLKALVVGLWQSDGEDCLYTNPAPDTVGPHLDETLCSVHGAFHPRDVR